eukprot:TRINITY_DN1016_c0_g1_i1.p1 TRINITY_DN1016_c0_g1~~TRINITY_DN1016_c0_g1_i1.p1  ORF type:complete len:130 (-),score=52.50 TRINITY_DN1016_c0_g1_i1:165-530(-)
MGKKADRPAASQRFSLRHQHKVKRKVAEHHRKLRKKAKKEEHARKKKDVLVIPNRFPLKAELMQQQMETAVKLKVLRDAQRKEKKELREERRKEKKEERKQAKAKQMLAAQNKAMKQSVVF